MSDQEDRKPQHSEPQKPVQDQKSGSQPNQPVQQKQPIPTGQPKTPQSEQEKHLQANKKHAQAAADLGEMETQARFD
jgi:hypothetical protein